MDERRTEYSDDLWGCTIDKHCTPKTVMLFFTLFLSVSQDSFEIVVRLERRRVRGLKLTVSRKTAYYSNERPTSLVRRASFSRRRSYAPPCVRHRYALRERRRKIQVERLRHMRGNETPTQAVFRIRERPSARRGPGVVSVDRNVRSKCRYSCVLQFTR